MNKNMEGNTTTTTYVNTECLKSNEYCRNMLNTGSCKFGDKCFYSKFHILCLIINELSSEVKRSEDVNKKYGELSVENNELKKMNDNLNFKVEKTIELLQQAEDKNKKLEEKYKELETIKNQLEQLISEIMSNNELK